MGAVQRKCKKALKNLVPYDMKGWPHCEGFVRAVKKV